MHKLYDSFFANNCIIDVWVYCEKKCLAINTRSLIKISWFLNFFFGGGEVSVIKFDIDNIKNMYSNRIHVCSKLFWGVFYFVFNFFILILQITKLLIHITTILTLNMNIWFFYSLEASWDCFRRKRLFIYYNVLSLG